MAGDVATVSVRVEVPQQMAFSIFTEEIDRWWRRGFKFRHAGGAEKANGGIIRIEPGVGGRLFESFESDSGTTVFETGRVTLWEPPRRFALEWRNSNFAPHEKTLVEVSFEDHGETTLVTVRHSGWSALPDDHPARHGKTGAEFARMIGMWWADLLTSLRQLADDR
ncbi:MAG: SRPBCC domain-containing protein [Polyangiales bacterium]